MRADSLRAYERLLAQGDTARIADITRTTSLRKVFNIEVFGVHVYSVGSSGILVHNGELFDGLDESLYGLGYTYELLDKDGRTIYYGQAKDFENLKQRRGRHIIEKAGQCERMRVVAQGLTPEEIHQLENFLMSRTLNGMPYERKNIYEWLLNDYGRPGIKRDDTIIERIFNEKLVEKDIWACAAR